MPDGTPKMMVDLVLRCWDENADRRWMKFFCLNFYSYFTSLFIFSHKLFRPHFDEIFSIVDCLMNEENNTVNSEIKIIGE